MVTSGVSYSNRDMTDLAAGCFFCGYRTLQAVHGRVKLVMTTRFWTNYFKIMHFLSSE